MTFGFRDQPPDALRVLPRSSIRSSPIASDNIQLLEQFVVHDRSSAVGGGDRSIAPEYVAYDAQLCRPQECSRHLRHILVCATYPNALQRTGTGRGKSPGIAATAVPSFCSIGAILPSRPARSQCRRAQRLSRMARLRATAPAARSVLDGREHGGTLSRVGKPVRSRTKQNIKK
jgi:hypothetical protein